MGAIVRCTGLGLLVALAAACGGDDPDAISGSGSSGSGFGNAGTGGAAPADDGGAGFTPGGLTLDPDSPACKRVDLIISVDGSGSMTEELTAIRDEVFPAFADRLLEVGKGLEDFRVATLDACPSPANFHTRGADAECRFEGGRVWMESLSGSLRDEFACVGDLYQEDAECSGDNDDEQPASAAAAALEQEFGGGANAGFSRVDSLLVVIAITDEDEQPTDTADDGQAVRDRIVAAKGGDAQRVVFLGIGGSRQCRGVYGDSDRADTLQDTVDAFGDNGFFWDLCEGRLEDGIDEVFAVIDRACDGLPPPPAVPPELSEGPQ